MQSRAEKVMGAQEHPPASGLASTEIPAPQNMSSPPLSAAHNNDSSLPSSHPPFENETQRISRPSSSTQNSRSTSSFPPEKTTLSPPPISFSPWSKKTSILVCTLGLLFFDLALPCLIYYTLHALTDLNIEVNLGISCASLGLGELLELPLRGYRLFKHPDIYGPLGQQSKWGFDFLFWWYLVATVIGIVPYVFSTSLDEPILWLFLFTPGFLAGFAVATAGISLFPFRLPFRVSSDAKGERCKPFAYYVMEDFVAVDADQRRLYREELRERWDASPVFRGLLWEATLWWTVGGVVFTGALAGITWGCDFNVAYGLSFGVLFIWIGFWAAATWVWANWRLKRERRWFARRRSIDGDVEKNSDS